ncbi:E3 ubiquitin-protein ligase TRIM71-like [Oopsacas minuta]|uniref:E3 ubiquitin-protein ligase TRIM71-like n=1 Tax=Oopsacas minuta TaxID=111878 RepID=A0AAV7KHB5_9METZ|nr:E3 ubiquitin-protein ligase TRIM71-like [Oopsacas minuta]
MYHITRMESLVKKGKLLFSEKNEPEFQFGKRGTEFDMITLPVGIALNSKETVLFVCDILSQKIQVYTIDGYFMTSFGTDHLKKPCGITMYGNRLYVTDVRAHSLLMFGNYGVKATGKCGIRIGELQFPRSVTCDSKGDVYVTDCGNLRIVVYSGELELKRIIASGQTWTPIDSRIFHKEIIVLSQHAPFIRCINLVDNSERNIYEVDKNVKNPCFFCVDKFGNFVINDAGSKRIVITNPRGELLKIIDEGSSGSFMFGTQITSYNKIIVALCAGRKTISVI